MSDDLSGGLSGELRLNSLERFRKRSDRLVLEEHSHCEVPAGCGGVVLRWRNPHAGVPVVYYGLTPGQVEVTLDGRSAPTGRLSIPPGEHVLTLHVAERDPARPGVLLFRARRDDPHTDGPTVLTSSGDGTWLATSEAPADSWTALDDDDSHWPALPLARFDANTLPDNLRWRYERLLDHGAMPLALPDGEFWVRKRFHMEEPS